MAWPDFDYDIWEDFEDGTLETGLTEDDTGGFLTIADTEQYKVGTHAMEIDHNSKNASATIDYQSLVASTSFGFWYRTGSNLSDFGSGPNFFRVDHWGEGQLLVLVDEKSAGDNTRQIRCFSKPSNTNTIPVSDSTWYWITLKFTLNGTCYLSVYDTSENLVGEEKSFAMGDYTVGYTVFQLGAYGATAWSCKTYWDGYVIDKTDASYPLLGWESGGSALEATISDSVGISDSLSRLTGFSRSIADSIGITDVVSRITGFIRSLTDTEGIESYDFGNVESEIYSEITDTVGITDSITTSSDKSRSLSDTVGTTDLLSRSGDFIRTLSDSTGITDLIDYLVSGPGIIYRTISDTLGITDENSRIGTFIRTILTTEGITDIISRTMIYIRSFSDSVGITDVLSYIFPELVTLYMRGVVRFKSLMTGKTRNKE
jgi:hypothetical protein